MVLPDVTTVLWQERDLLSAVVTGLTRPGEQDDAPRPVADVLTDLERVQQRRRLLVDRAGTALGLPSGCTLADLAEAAPEPWADLLRGHIDALLVATNDLVVAAVGGSEEIDVRAT